MKAFLIESMVLYVGRVDIPRQTARYRTTYSEMQLKEAIRAVKIGMFNRKEAAFKFNIPYPTLNRRLRSVNVSSQSQL